MTRTGSLGTTVMLLGMMLLIGVAALVLLSSAQSIALPTMQKQVTIDWLRPNQVTVPQGLSVRAHAAKHNGEAEQIYKMLLQGQCAAVAKFCGGSDTEKMYVCVDPITGIVGAVLQFGDEITTGYYERSGSDYWAGRTSREDWEVCR